MTRFIALCVRTRAFAGEKQWLEGLECPSGALVAVPLARREDRDFLYLTHCCGRSCACAAAWVLRPEATGRTVLSAHQAVPDMESAC